MNWKLPWRRMDSSALLDAAAAVVAELEDVRVVVEADEEDLACLFHVDDPEDPYTVELTVYDMEDGLFVLALEEEWADNDDAWDAACQFAEDLAEQLGAWEIDLD